MVQKNISLNRKILLNESSLYGNFTVLVFIIDSIRHKCTKITKTIDVQCACTVLYIIIKLLFYQYFFFNINIDTKMLKINNTFFSSGKIKKMYLD